ncbi:TPA: hypothetical protein ACPJ1C_002518 [Vibrio diabolicus]
MDRYTGAMLMRGLRLKIEVDDEFSVKTTEGYKEWFVNAIHYS